MATKIATEDHYVIDAGGIRRFVAKGTVVPGHLNMRDAKVKDGDPRTLSQPVVDADASRSMAERTGSEVRAPDAGLSMAGAEGLVKANRAAGRAAKPKE